MTRLKAFTIIFALLLITSSSDISAQAFRISAFGQQSTGLGDFENSDLNDKNAAFATFGSNGGLELTYYIDQKIGVGIRWTSTIYGRDKTAYDLALKNELNIVDDNYYLDQPEAFLAFGTDVGFSYLFKTSDIFHIEPYLFFGFRTMGTRDLSAVYTNNGNTFQYLIEFPVYFGFAYSPGVKVHINVNDRLGFFVNGEYQLISYLEDSEEQVTFSANTLEVEFVERDYDINSFNLGIGVSYKLGKILSE